MQVWTVTSLIITWPGSVSVLPSRSNFTSWLLGRITATANGGWACAIGTQSALADAKRLSPALNLHVIRVSCSCKESYVGILTSVPTNIVVPNSA